MDKSDSRNEDTKDMSEKEKLPFKKPLLIGKVGRFPKKIVNSTTVDNKNTTEAEVGPTDANNSKSDEVKVKSVVMPAQILVEQNFPLPYKEPQWSGLPETSDKDYAFEVLKSGMIIENINLMQKPYWVFGRLSGCDIFMAHPTVSRYHAVLQYRAQSTDNQPEGFYLYDLTSTHGTFLNKNKLKPRVYTRVQVGHMIKLGCSTRTYLLTGPDKDVEDESELSITELKKKREEELLRRKEKEEEMAQQYEEEQEELSRKLEERGVDWGMGEDADEETDITENPFANSGNEELYLDDPKKALRGFMEREGYNLEYICNEQGIGQFLCKVELPLDDERGRPIFAEVLHKGKKKEAVVQCALEACRILDRYGLLRQATHESRKRKTRNWEENDYYDSDDDTYLDRTGTVEKKRENRMKARVPQEPETYQSLVEKQNKLIENITNIERQLSESTSKSTDQKSTPSEEDSLDSFMKELKQTKLDKQKINKLKRDLCQLKQEYMDVEKLINIAKPASLPPLAKEEVEINKIDKKKLPMYGKRLKVKVQLPVRTEKSTGSGDDEENISENTDLQEKYLSQCSKIEMSFKKIYPLMSTEQENHLRNIWSNLKRLRGDYSSETKQEILQLVSNYITDITPVIKDTFSDEIDEITSDITSVTDEHNITEVGFKLINLAKEITHIINKLVKDEQIPDVDNKLSEEELERRRRKNQRRIQHRQEKAEVVKQRGYQEDASREDYNMWVPPEGQTGDGRTSLNDKLGY